MSIRRLALVLFALFAVCLVGCASPCDRYCDNAADYIEFCLENGTQGAWQAANDGGGWTTWGVSSRDEYNDNCKSDLSDQLAGEHGDSIEGACEDDANQYFEWVERETCIDLP